MVATLVVARWMLVEWWWQHGDDVVVGARVVWEENEKPFCVKQQGNLTKVYYYLFKNNIEEKLGSCWLHWSENLEKVRKWKTLVLNNLEAYLKFIIIFSRITSKGNWEEEKVRKLRRWVGYASRYCCLLACNFLLFSKKDRLHPVFMIC